VFANRFSVLTFDDYDKFLPKNGIKQGHILNQEMSNEEVKEKLSQIKGHLVWFPLRFLENAEMAEKGMAVNAITESIYT
jgi:phospholipase D1/2